MHNFKKYSSSTILNLKNLINFNNYENNISNYKLTYFNKNKFYMYMNFKKNIAILRSFLKIYAYFYVFYIFNQLNYRNKLNFKILINQYISLFSPEINYEKH